MIKSIEAIAISIRISLRCFFSYKRFQTDVAFLNFKLDFWYVMTTRPYDMHTVLEVWKTLARL